MAFHYEVISRHQTLVNNPVISPDVKLDVIRSRIDTFMGRRFELLCRDYILDSYVVGDIGTWWGRTDGTDTDIDIVATVYDRDRRVSNLMVECKFSRKAMNCKVLDDLEAKTENTSSIPNLRYMIVAVSGFDTELEDAMEDGRVILVGTDKLLGRVPPDDLESFPMRGLELIG